MRPVQWLLLALCASGFALAQAVTPSARAVKTFAGIHAQLQKQGYKVECDAPVAYKLQAKDWDSSVDAAVAIVDKLKYVIVDTMLVEPELGVAVIDTDPNDPTAFGYGVLEVGQFALELCWITKL